MRTLPLAAVEPRVALPPAGPALPALPPASFVSGAPRTPPQAGALAFEHALHRAGRPGRGAPGDDNAVLPEATTAAPPLQAAAQAAVQAPRPVAAPDAVATHLRALNLPDTPAAAGHWQLQWPGLEQPVLQVQRSVGGALHLVLSAAPEQQRSTPLAALRERLQARGHSLAVHDLDVHNHDRIHRRPPEEPA